MAPPDLQKWLLLIHQIPPKPDYFRVKIWRRLRKVGA
ncbi:MAG: ChrB protein, partial [Deltaproteobacteria bacterium]